jgi:hypothetical protein
MSWIGGIDQLEKRDELATAVAVLDQGMDLAGDKVDAGQQADRAVALVLKPQRGKALRYTEGSAPRPVASPSVLGSNENRTLLIGG